MLFIPDISENTGVVETSVVFGPSVPCNNTEDFIGTV
jgi:hypothetical protein